MFHFARRVVGCNTLRTSLQQSNALKTGALSITAVAIAVAVHENESHSNNSTSKTHLFSWGSNQYGQLGLGSEIDQTLPSMVTYLTNMNEDPKEVCCGGAHTAVLTESGAVYTCGVAVEGNIGTQSILERLQMPQNIKISTISMGIDHGAAIDMSGNLYTWGKNNRGQLGHSNDKPASPGLVQSDVKFKAVSCGRLHTAAIDVNGNLWTWGNGKDGALGLDSRESFGKPVKVEQFSGKVVQVSCGRESTLILLNDGTVYSCGSNDYGQLGLDMNANSRYQRSPMKITSLANEKVVGISSGEFHCCCVTESGKVYTWGQGTDGQLGHGDKESLTHPRKVSALTDIAMVSCGGGHTAFLATDGNLFLSGRGRNGQLGRADSIESVAAYRAKPVHVNYFDTATKIVKQVSCGADHTVCISGDV